MTPALRGVALATALFVAVPAAAEPLAVWTDSYPVAYFAGRIAGDLVEVTLPVPADRDPAFWVPSIAEIAGYQQADLVLLNGAGLAQWTTRATLPRARTVDTSAAFAGRFIETPGVTHSHGPEGEHSHSAVAAFTWLDFAQAELQADAVRAALVARRPEATAHLEEGFAALATDLRALDADAREVGALAAGRPIVASHPGYQYFARRYELAIDSVSWDVGAAPGEEQVAELDTLLARHPATLMLWEAPPSPEAEAALAARGVRSVVFPTLAIPAAEGGFVASGKASLARLRSALSP